MPRPGPTAGALALSLAAVVCAAPSAALAQVTFSSPVDFTAGTGVVAVAVGEFNGDTDPDLAVVNAGSDSVSILLGGVGGSFSPQTSFDTSTTPISIAVGEFNGDTDPDLAVANDGDGNVSILLGAAGGSFSGPTNFDTDDGPYSVAVGSFNSDSDTDLDLAVANSGSDNLSVLLGGGDGSFGAPTNFDLDGEVPFSVVVGEFNGDPQPDLAVANASAVPFKGQVLLGIPGGSFAAPTDFPTGGFSFSLATGEFNGDTDPDLAVANESTNSVSVLVGAAGGTFTAVDDFAAGVGPYAVAVGEFNGDADPDLLVANPVSDEVSVLLGGVGGSFSGPTSFGAGDAPEGVAVGDFNGDGRQDLAVANNNSSNVSVLLNTTGLDTTPPETTIDAAPPAISGDNTPTFSFSSNEPASTFECSLDSAAFAPCGSPFDAPALADGPRSFQVRAIDLAGNIDPTPASHAFTIDPTALPDPVLGRQVNLIPRSGKVLVSVAGSQGLARLAQRSPIKGRRFVPLEEARQVPVGSFLDTRKGKVRIVSATGTDGKTQPGDFASGVFQILQSRKASERGLTELRMKGSSFASCRPAGRGKRAGGPAARAVAEVAARRRLSRRTVRRLSGDANGRFRTRGRHSAATVRGTVWLTTDRCDGTLTKVSRGRVDVRDFRRKRTVTVRAGKRYLARAPG